MLASTTLLIDREPTIRIAVGARAGQRQPQAHVRLGKVRPEPDRLAVCRRRLGIARLLEERPSKLHVRRDAVGLEEDGVLEDCFRLRRPPLAAQHQAEPEVGLQAVGLGLDGLAKSRLGFRVAALPGPELGLIAQGF